MKTRITALIVVLSALSSAAVAEPVFSTGCMVESSPFYDKLLQARVFDSPLLFPAKAESLNTLFTTAHLFRYKEDNPKKEKWQSAEETRKRFQGDCADKAIWLYTQMRQNGYSNVTLVIGRYSPSSKVLHMWVNYVDPSSGTTLLLDPTMQRRAWKITDFSKRYYKPAYSLSGDDCKAY